MPRPQRLDEPGAIHHVMARGVDRRNIFRDDADRGAFVDRFERVACDLGFRCDALTLLANHLHAVIHTGEIPLARLMHRLNGVHAQRFNRANERTGHLFAARYKARRVTDDGDLARVVAYAIGNPLRHRLVDRIDALYADPWNALSMLSGRRRPRRFESPARMAELLGADPRRAIAAQALDAEAEDAALEPELLEELERLIAEMCARHGVAHTQLRARKNRRLRRTLLATATRTLGIPVVDASRAIGVSRSCAQRTLASND